MTPKFSIDDCVMVDGRAARVHAIHISKKVPEAAVTSRSITYDVTFDADGSSWGEVAEDAVSLSEVEKLRREVERLNGEVQRLRSKQDVGRFGGGIGGIQDRYFLQGAQG